MSLDASVLVDLPDSGITVARCGKYRPVYNVLRSYLNEKGKPTNDRVIIGKLDLETGKLIPNHNYYQYYKPLQVRDTLGKYEEIQTQGSHDVIKIHALTQYNVSIGSAFLIGRIMSSHGLPQLLNECLGIKRSRMIQTAVLYMVARNNVFENVLDFC
ncbi:MAG: hypothetical protein LBV23_08770 [Deltaproteobacteria bacterium]|jgi:hypothetical protein|nr:hypothetical protein [Deltaproteobacteria bacterium]